MPADYTTELARNVPCPCVFSNYGTKGGAVQGCALCQGSGSILRTEFTRFYERFVQEAQGSGEWEISQPPTLPIHETPLKLTEILLPGVTNRVAMQTVEHVTYWVCPNIEQNDGSLYLAVKPYLPKEIYLQRGFLWELNSLIHQQLRPHPRSNGWLSRTVAEVGHAR